jgi:2,4-dienoyl-CoA reductase-like NADH-dependent reductase (Old Yellow Enzyme family)
MKLLQTTKIGNLTLNNSMAMAPMTRSRADFNGVVPSLIERIRQIAISVCSVDECHVSD